jgi:hypothetical protein
MADYSYLIRKKILTLFGASFHIYDPNDQLIGFCHQKAFKLKEDIRIYTDESKSQEFLNIQARHIIDFSAAYDVFDSASGTLLGTWQRKGFSSIFRDHWLLFSPDGNQIGEIKEDSMGMALFRRFLCTWIPQDYELTYLDQGTVATYKQHFNPFVFKLDVALAPNNTLSPMLILAGGILLAAIEGRQQ